mmetsp:Transcript_69/g.147  ORF Transcript_69/g.147 Transcript_69/m.147 type:complete len:271 (-) Transcript_69:2696-3508(-)
MLFEHLALLSILLSLKAGRQIGSGIANADCQLVYAVCPAPLDHFVDMVQLDGLVVLRHLGDTLKVLRVVRALQILHQNDPQPIGERGFPSLCDEGSLDSFKVGLDEALGRNPLQDGLDGINALIKRLILGHEGYGGNSALGMLVRLECKPDAVHEPLLSPDLLKQNIRHHIRREGKAPIHVHLGVIRRSVCKPLRHNVIIRVDAQPCALQDSPAVRGRKSHHSVRARHVIMNCRAVIVHRALLELHRKVVLHFSLPHLLSSARGERAEIV